MSNVLKQENYNGIEYYTFDINKVVNTDEPWIISRGFIKLSSLLTGLSLATNTPITSSDSVIGAFGKLQAQITTNNGTVTSVALTMPTGFSVSGSPITSSGTFAVTLSSGYNLVTDAEKTTWNDKFNTPTGTTAQYIRGNGSLGDTSEFTKSIFLSSGADIETISNVTHEGYTATTVNTATNTPVGGYMHYIIGRNYDANHKMLLVTAWDNASGLYFRKKYNGIWSDYKLLLDTESGKGHYVWNAFHATGSDPNNRNDLNNAFFKSNVALVGTINGSSNHPTWSSQQIGIFNIRGPWTDFGAQMLFDRVSSGNPIVGWRQEHNGTFGPWKAFAFQDWVSNNFALGRGYSNLTNINNLITTTANSYLGSLRDGSIWYNIISANSSLDHGTPFGLQIRLPMETQNTNLQFRQIVNNTFYNWIDIVTAEFKGFVKSRGYESNTQDTIMDIDKQSYSGSIEAAPTSWWNVLTVNNGIPHGTKYGFQLRNHMTSVNNLLEFRQTVANNHQSWEAFAFQSWVTNGFFLKPTGTTAQYIRGDGSLATFPTGGTGTVTSVGLTMPTGFSVAGSPITSSGTFAVTLTSGYNLVTDAEKTTWNGKFNTPSGTTAQYIRGDGSLATFPTIPTITDQIVYGNGTGLSSSNKFTWNDTNAILSLNASTPSLRSINTNSSGTSNFILRLSGTTNPSIGAFHIQVLNQNASGPLTNGNLISIRNENTARFVISHDGTTTISHLSGTGTRMVVADASGVLSTQTIPTSNPGTVTSVGLTMPTGFTVSGSPITSSGTFAVTLTSGYHLVTTAEKTTWNGKFNTPTGTTAQYIRGDGTLATFPTIPTIPVQNMRIPFGDGTQLVNSANFTYDTSGILDIAGGNPVVRGTNTGGLGNNYGINIVGRLTTPAMYGIWLAATNTAGNAIITSGNIFGITNYTTEYFTIAHNGVTKINNLSGTGTRMVVADTSGNLSTQTIPSGGGGVTSVALTMPTGFSVSGSPITTSGTFAVTLTSGYHLVTTAEKNYWDNKLDTPTGNTQQVVLGNGTLSLTNQFVSDGFNNIVKPVNELFMNLRGEKSQGISVISIIGDYASSGGGSGTNTDFGHVLIGNNRTMKLLISDSPSDPGRNYHRLIITINFDQTIPEDIWTSNDIVTSIIYTGAIASTLRYPGVHSIMVVQIDSNTLEFEFLINTAFTVGAGINPNGNSGFLITNTQI